MEKNVGDGECQIGSLSLFLGKKQEKSFSKKVKSRGKTNCRRKKKSRQSQDIRFQSQRLIPA